MLPLCEHQPANTGERCTRTSSYHVSVDGFPGPGIYSCDEHLVGLVDGAFRMTGPGELPSCVVSWVVV